MRRRRKSTGSLETVSTLDSSAIERTRRKNKGRQSIGKKTQSLIITSETKPDPTTATDVFDYMSKVDRW